MKEILEWAIEELMMPHRLRKNQILGAMNQVTTQSVEFSLLDKDRPEQGVVELLKVQVSQDTSSANSPQPRITCRVYKLMEATPTPPAIKSEDAVLLFISTQALIGWLQNGNYQRPKTEVA